MPFFMQLEWKMSAKEVEIIERIPKPEIDHGACSRDEPQPKLSPAIRMTESRYEPRLRTKSSISMATSGPCFATSFGLV